MAADILAYKTDEVPVGDDQRQHVELARDIAERFNARFADILVVPRARIPETGARIMDLQDPMAKMSTTAASDAGVIRVLDEPATIVKKVKSAVTDSGSDVVRSPDKPGITNLIDILAVIRGQAPEQVESEFNGSGYGQFKQTVADAVVDYLAPSRTCWQPGPRRPARSPPRRWWRCAGRWASGLPPKLHRWQSPRSTSTSRSSRARSTCC
jgi:tryptophanyl-tRNA synthetase